MTLAERAYELQQKINVQIDMYGQCTESDAEEMDRLCDQMTEEDSQEFLKLFRDNNSK
jgi:hypothetical protein